MDYNESNQTLTTTKGNYEPFEIAILSGTTIQREIKAVTAEGSNVFINGTALERVDRLTAAIDPLSSNITIVGGSEGENNSSKSEGMGKVGARGGKLGYNVGLDLGFYIRLNKVHTDDGEVKYYYDQLYILFGVNANVQKDFQIFIGPVPCYISIGGGITVKGLVGMVPNKGVNTEFGSDGVKSDTDVLREGGMDVAGLIIIRPRFKLGAGVGVRGAISIGVAGESTIDIVYQPWADG
ncbi:MAG: hypothetical protein IJ736_05940, partial [Firmicutes bacterium]|nr:hypothetical protein [Bacillota bacterium]